MTTENVNVFGVKKPHPNKGKKKSPEQIAKYKKTMADRKILLREKPEEPKTELSSEKVINFAIALLEQKMIKLQNAIQSLKEINF